MTDNTKTKYIFTEIGLKTLFIYIYFYIINDPNPFSVECERVPLIIDDLYIQDYDTEYCSIIFERYGILKSIKY
jgi:hypothetical protein